MEGRRVHDEHLEPVEGEASRIPGAQDRGLGLTPRGMPDGLDEIVGRWKAAEDRLHPVALVQPETYARYLRLVRLVADELGFARTREQLITAYGKAPATVQTAISRRGTGAEGLDLQLVAGAAFGLRYREVLAQLRRDETIRRVRTAWEHGDRWVVIDDAGGIGGPGLPPYRKLEMHLPDGVGLHSFVELDPEMDRPVYGAEIVRLDPQTGRGVVSPETPSEPVTFTRREAWEAAVKELRARLGGE